MDSVYLDANATTPLLPAVWEAMLSYWAGQPGNPASSHRFGRRARQALDHAREQIAHLLDAHPDEVVFTSGATEANNLALFGLAGPPPGRILSSAIEHPCVVEPIRRLVDAGFTYEALAIDARGCVVLPESFPQADTRLVSVMLANHETGAIQPVQALAARLGEAAPLHCDAAAAVGKIPVSFARLGVAAMTITAHKFHGPAGIGALLLRRSTHLQPLLWGGHQQGGRRPGTEPVALAVGMARALDLAVSEHALRWHKVKDLRRVFLEELRTHGSPITVNGPEEGGIPHALNVSFPGCQADVLLMKLDLAGIACSTGSACSSGSLLPSPVLQAMGVATQSLSSAMRFSVSHLLSESEVCQAARLICSIANDLRRRKKPATKDGMEFGGQS